MGAIDSSGELLSNVGFLAKIDGTRIPLMDESGVPKGFVVDARAGDPLWEFMKPGVIPLKPREGLYGIRIGDIIKAHKQLAYWRAELEDPEAFLVMVPHSDAESEWWAKPIRPSDLRRENPESLLEESMDALQQADELFADALETAYRARTGAFDLH